MSPITDRNQAREGGFAQVREALTSFEMDIIPQDARGRKTEFGMFSGGQAKDGSPLKPREYLDIVGTNVAPLVVTEPLSMDISEGWSIREWCSDFKGSFWVEAFLASADKFKVLIPDGLIGKRVRFKKYTQKAYGKDNQPQPEFDSTNYIIDGVSQALGSIPTGQVQQPAPQPVQQPVQQPAPSSYASSSPQQVIQQPQQAPAPVSNVPASGDPMEVAVEIAVGKTENQFRSAAAMHDVFKNSPFLPLVKTGALTQSLINDGKLVLVEQNGKQVYQKVE